MNSADTILLLSSGLVFLGIIILSMVIIKWRVELSKKQTEEEEIDSELQMETI